MKAFCFIIFWLFVNEISAQVEKKIFNTAVNNKIILVGENHVFEENHAINYAFLKKLHSNKIYPKYIILEYGHGTAFLLNKYFQTEDKQLLDLLFPLNLRFGQDFYKDLFILNNSLPDSNKFNFVGVDYDYDYDAMHLSLRYLLLSDLQFAKDTTPSLVLETLEDDEKINYLIGTFMSKKNLHYGGKMSLKRTLT